MNSIRSDDRYPQAGMNKKMSCGLTRVAWLLIAPVGILFTFSIAEAQLLRKGIHVCVQVREQPAASSTPCVPSRLSVKPIDELKKDASFRKFKRRLMDIAARRDATALYRLFSPEFFEVGCCEEGPNYKGIRAVADFKDMAVNDPNLQWLLVQQALQVGVVKTERTYDGYTSDRPNNLLFCGPATDSPPVSFACDFSGSQTIDGNLAFVIGTRVPLRLAPDPSAKAITELSWDMVEGLSLDWGKRHNWAKVRLGDGTVGYVNSRFVHWSLGPTLCFSKEGNGQWAIRGIDLGGD